MWYVLHVKFNLLLLYIYIYMNKVYRYRIFTIFVSGDFEISYELLQTRISATTKI